MIFFSHNPSDSEQAKQLYELAQIFKCIKQLQKVIRENYCSSWQPVFIINLRSGVKQEFDKVSMYNKDNREVLEF